MKFVLDKTAVVEGLKTILLSPDRPALERQGAAYDLLTQHPDKLPEVLQGTARIPDDTLEIIGKAFQECGAMRNDNKLSEKQFTEILLHKSPKPLNFNRFILRLNS